MTTRKNFSLTLFKLLKIKQLKVKTKHTKDFLSINNNNNKINNNNYYKNNFNFKKIITIKNNKIQKLKIILILMLQNLTNSNRLKVHLFKKTCLKLPDNLTIMKTTK